MKTSHKNAYLFLFSIFSISSCLGISSCIPDSEPIIIPETIDPIPESNIDPEPINPIPESNIIQKPAEYIINPIPIAEWLNASLSGIFFDPTLKKLCNKKEYFNAIDALGLYYINLKPYGFSSNYTLKHHPFKLTTAGVSLQGGLSLAEKWSVGGDVTYWHSSFTYSSAFKNTQINSLRFGPSASYLFKKGYIELDLAAIYNSFQAEPSSSNWNLNAQIVGALNWQINNYSIQPKLNLNYLFIFKKRQPNDNEPLSKEADFLKTVLSIQFAKEIQKEKILLIPALSLGWALMQPISDISSTCQSKKISLNNSNQGYISFKLSSIHKRGILISIELDGYIAKLYPAYLGNMRIELDW